jgi:hypothetical protein
MTKSAARRAIAGGCNARVINQTAPTKSLNHNQRTGVAFGAGLFIFGNMNAISETKPPDKPPWITGR